MDTQPAGNLLDYAALEAATVAGDPFPHLIVRGFVPPAALAAIHADIPKTGKGGSFPPEALALGPAAKALVRELEGDALKAAIGGKFGLDLADAPTMLTLRVACRAKDGQIHTDSAAKRVTVLLYLNPDGFEAEGGCLRLLRGPDDLADYTVEVPPTRGTLLVFPNGPATWHGHLPYVGHRASIQLNYMAAGAAARRELRRHRLSALIKRFL